MEVRVITACVLTVTCAFLSACASTDSRSRGAGPPTSSIASASAAASKVSADQSKAIWDNFQAALNGVVADMSDRQLVTKAVGRKLPGMLAGLL